MQENKPFIEDVYQCFRCGEKASYVCPNCGNLKYCEKCVVKRHGKPAENRYCLKCLCKVSEIPLRFVGATGSMPKKVSVPHRHVKIMEAPKIYPKADRDKIKEQS